VELTSDSEPESVVEVGGPGLGFNANRRQRSLSPVFPASDLRLRLSHREMTRHVAERGMAIPKRKRRPDHSITISARPPQPAPVVTISPERVPVITITTDRAQSPYSPQGWAELTNKPIAIVIVKVTIVIDSNLKANLGGFECTFYFMDAKESVRLTTED
jgi:hypothetical protein